jgi:hypothetical protein
LRKIRHREGPWLGQPFQDGAGSTGIAFAQSDSYAEALSNSGGFAIAKTVSFAFAVSEALPISSGFARSAGFA